MSPVRRRRSCKVSAPILRRQSQAVSAACEACSIFDFRSPVLPRLSPRLRVLVGSAEVLQGGVESSDFVEIHFEAPRINMVTCDDINRHIPFIIERTQVDLGRLKVSTDRREPETMPVYFKSRFMSSDDPARDRQIAFEKMMSATGLFAPNLREPEWSKVKARLQDLVPEL